MTKPQTRIGIALGGGGAKGFAHIGVLQALERVGIIPEIVTGTSAGALVGASYASGTLETFTEDVKKISLTDIPLLLSPTWSTKGLFSGKNALEMLNQYLSAENIEELPKRYAAVSVDLTTSQPYYHCNGNLKTAVRASIAIPGLFTPVVDDSRVLVDGGILDPVPTEINRKLGAEYVIAVNLFPPQSNMVEELLDTDKANSTEERILPKTIDSAVQYLNQLSTLIPITIPGITINESDESSPIKTIIDVIESTLAVSQQHLTEMRFNAHPPDLVIEPDVRDIGILDFHRGDAFIERGVEAVERVLDKLPL